MPGFDGASDSPSALHDALTGRVSLSQPSLVGIHTCYVNQLALSDISAKWEHLVNVRD